MQHEALAPFGLFGLLVALLGLDVVVGDLGFQCPFRGFPRGTAHCSLEEISPERVDLVMVPGAFCPWNCIVAETLPVFLQRVYEAGKIVTGICHASVALAVARLPEGKNTGWLAYEGVVPIMGGTYSSE